MSAKLSAETKRAVIHHVETLNKSQTATAAAFGISRSSVKSILRNRVRTASEFRPMPVSPDHPRVMGGNYTWTLGEIRAARDALLRGEFKLPVKMCEAMGTNYAIATARSNRVDPSSALTAQLVAHDTARGQNICSHARKHVTVPAAVIKSAHEYLVDLGVSVLHTVHVPFSGDTGFTGFRVELWPMEFVKWDYGRDCLTTQTAGGETVEIHHGDGEWTVIQSYDFKPFTKGCALAAALIWGANTYGMLDWNASARTHGLAKMIGELPADTPLVNDAGELTDQAKAFLEMMRQIVDGDSPAGIIPPGAKTQFVNNSSTAWQIFNQLIMTTDKAAARVYQGTDATLGSVGGAPGVDISTLFGVATTKVQGDLSAIERALNTGVYEPWTAVNYGDSKQAPSWTYKIPDPDLERKSDEESKNEKRLTDALKERRALGLVVDQDVVNALSKKFNVFPVPQLAQSSDAKPSIALAPTDIVKVVTVDEARLSAGLGKLGGPAGDKFVSELGLPPGGLPV